MRALIFSLLIPLLARAGGPVWVSPDTPSAPPPPEPEKISRTPPDCVEKVLNAIFEKEKAYFAEKKAYSESLVDIRALSAIGLGCKGWDVPVVKITYGGSGYAAVMSEPSTGVKWTLNQDKALILEEAAVLKVEPKN